jgi:hypothetical protein
MSLLEFVRWCDALPVSVAIRESLWAFAVIEAVHLIALALIGGLILIVDLQLLGFGLAQQPLARLANDNERWLIGALIVMIGTGIALFLSEAEKCYNSTPFWWKIGLLLVAIPYTFTVRRTVIRKDVAGTGMLRDRFVALASLTLWFGVGAAGRWIGFSAG